MTSNSTDDHSNSMILYRVYTGQNWPGTARYGAGTVGAGRCLHYGNRKWAECVFERSSVNNGRVVSREHSSIMAALALVLSTSSSSRSKSFSSSSQSSLKRRRHQAHLRLARFKQRQSVKKAMLYISLSVCLLFRLAPQPRSVWTIPR